MAVYLPTAVVGNGRVLVTLGASAEVMGFFYPHVDFAQNVHECMTALFFEGGVLHWTWQPEFERKQRYDEDTNILVSELRHKPTGLQLAITDFVPPDVSALIRLYRLCNESGKEQRAKLFQYFELRLGGQRWENAVEAVPEQNMIVQWWRNFAL